MFLRDSPQKTHFSVWVDLACFPSPTALHHSSSAVPSACTHARTWGSSSPRRAPARSHPSPSFPCTIQDCSGFCPIPPRSFPSRRDLVHFISACTVCRREISLDGSAVGAVCSFCLSHLFLCFPFLIIFNPRKSFHFIPWHSSQRTFSMVLYQRFSENPHCGDRTTIFCVYVEILFWVSSYGWQTISVSWKKYDLHILPNISYNHIYPCIYPYMLFSYFFQLALRRGQTFSCAISLSPFQIRCQVCYIPLRWCQGWYKW